MSHIIKWFKSLWNIISLVFISIKLILIDIWDFTVPGCVGCKKECPVQKEGYIEEKNK